jgi:predicted HicB family RNase H-like nuclease
MSDIVSYRGYQARIEFDAEDRIFFGRIAGIEDGVGFHADTVDALLDAFREAVDDYLATCAVVGKSPDKPYSGKLMFRVDPEIHAEAALAAKLSGQSLNMWAEEALRQAARATVSKAVPL